MCALLSAFVRSLHGKRSTQRLLRSLTLLPCFPSAADSVAADSQRLPVWFSVGTKGSADKVCNEVFPVAVLLSRLGWLLIVLLTGLHGFVINRSRDMIGL